MVLHNASVLLFRDVRLVSSFWLLQIIAQNILGHRFWRPYAGISAGHVRMSGIAKDGVDLVQF